MSYQEMIERLETERMGESFRDTRSPERLRTQLGQAHNRIVALERELARRREPEVPLRLHAGGRRRKGGAA